MQPLYTLTPKDSHCHRKVGHFSTWLKVVITSSEFLTSLVLLLIQSCLVTVALVFEQVLGLSKQECFFSAEARLSQQLSGPSTY